MALLNEENLPKLYITTTSIFTGGKNLSINQLLSKISSKFEIN